MSRILCHWFLLSIILTVAVNAQCSCQGSNWCRRRTDQSSCLNRPNRGCTWNCPQPTTPPPSSPDPTPQPTIPPPTPQPTTPQPTGNPTTSLPTKTAPCGPRVRREWRTLSTTEKNLYLNGIKALRNNGKLAIFTETHQQRDNGNQAHQTAAFLPWHRYFIFELETQIRALGGAYECFTLPFWDWTQESGQEFQNPLFADGLGTQGVSDSNSCVPDGAFTRADYTTPNLCNSNIDPQSDVDARTCCLKRRWCTGCNLLPLPTPAEAIRDIVTISVYEDRRRNRDGYRLALEFDGHSDAHVHLGKDSGSHLFTFFSPDDPFFYLLHTFVDFQWAAWQDCHDYDTVASAAITSDIYRGTGRNDGIDDVLLYNIMNGISWAEASKRVIRPRNMHDIVNSDYLGYTYDAGSFFTGSAQDSSSCLFGSWTIPPARRRRLAPPPHANSNRQKIRDEVKKYRGEIEKKYPKMSKNDKVKKIAKRSCEYARKLAEKQGLVQKCTYDKDYEKCGDGGILDISLDELLAKLGKSSSGKAITPSKCLIGIRKNFYGWAKKFGALRRLCNGRFDPSCDE